MTSGALERLFIYFPTGMLEGNPSQIGLSYQDVFLQTTDRIQLHAWFVPHDRARSTLIVFHGNAGNISHRLPWLEMLHGLELNVLLPDYRGYGRSEGSPREGGLYRDARAAYDWWVRERAASGEGLILVGESLGGAVAVDLASKVPADGLILQSTFTSARDMAQTLMPLGLLQPLARVYYDSAAKIGHVTCPKLFIHGDRDTIVPLGLGRRLYELAPEPKRFYEVHGAGHNDLLWVAGTQYVEQLRSFLASLHTPRP